MQVGQKLVQKDLGKTLRTISEKGADGFYKGWVADAIVTSSQANKGIITQADLDKYKTRELAPVECDYRGYHVVSAPPPSSGGVVICQIMNILEGYPMKDLGFHSAQGMHYQIEAMRHAYVDRNSYLGDPDFVKNPIEHLLDKNYATKLRNAIQPQKAGVSAELKPGVAPHEGSNTTHYSIVDKWGNAVSVTYTLNDWFGAGVMASKTGVILNDEMDDFTSKVGVPNMYGLVQGEANAIAPGQGTAVLDEPDHRHQGRQSGDGGRHAGRQPHHHRDLADHAQRHRLRHGPAGSGRRAALPPAMDAGGNQPRRLRRQPGHEEDPRELGPQVRRPAGCQPYRGDSGRCAFAGRQTGREEPLLRRQRSTAQYRLVTGLLSGVKKGADWRSAPVSRIDQGRLIMTTALLIIDVQRALCSGQYQCHDIHRVIDTINALSARARKAGVPVVLIQHEEKDSPLAHGAEGWQLAEGLADVRQRSARTQDHPGFVLPDRTAQTAAQRRFRTTGDLRSANRLLRQRHRASGASTGLRRGARFRRAIPPSTTAT